MSATAKSSVICLGDSKQAALYFDRVIIVDPAEHMGIWGLPELGQGAFNLAFNRDGSDQEVLQYNYQFQEYRKRLDLPSFSFSRVGDSDDFVSNTRKRLIEGYIDDAALPGGGTFRQALAEFASRLGIENAPVLLPSRYEDSAPPGDEDLSLSLTRLALVDTAKTGWEQILEIRRDEKSLSRLRNLRSVLAENYTGKDKDFVEDDLARRIETYENLCRDHGIETCLSVLTVVLDARHLQTALAGGIAAALLGSPLAGVGAAAALELGQVTLELARRRHAFRKLQRDHPMAWIIDARERLQAGSERSSGSA